VKRKADETMMKFTVKSKKFSAVVSYSLFTFSFII